jgi:HAD superfamily hydrolase (TIGR01509 family)
VSKILRRLYAKAILFDMDGVIINSRSVIESAWQEVSQRHSGRTLTDADLHEHVHGRQGSHTVITLFPDHSAQQRKEIWTQVNLIEETASYDAIPGVDALIHSLTTNQIATGLVTSSWTKKINHVIDLLQLQGTFETVINRDDVVRGKPHPDPYIAGCRRLGINPAETLVFEDSSSGVQSAVAAGAICVGIGDTELVQAGAIDAVPDFRYLKLVTAKDGTLLLTGTRHSITLLPRM